MFCYLATWITLTSIVICDLLGVQKLANAFGLLCLMRGAAALVGSPTAGIVSFNLFIFYSATGCE